MKTYTLYYSITPSGDGSAYSRFMESEALCEWDQDHIDEGWGESCTGSFTLASESDILPVDKIETKESYFISRYNDVKNKESKEFIEQFFPDGLPKFTVKTEDVASTTDYLYNKVFVGERLVAKVFKAKVDSGKKFEDSLNSIQAK